MALPLPKVTTQTDPFRAMLPKPPPIPQLPQTQPYTGGGGSWGPNQPPRPMATNPAFRPSGSAFGDNPLAVAEQRIPMPGEQTGIAAPAKPPAPGQQTSVNYGGTPNPNDPAMIGGSMMDPNRNKPPAPTAPPAVPNVTSDGLTINPATGGVKQPTAAEQAAAAAAKAYQGTLGQSPEEQATQLEQDRAAEGFGLGTNAIRNQPIMQQFITGQQAAMKRDYDVTAAGLEAKMARQQASRIAAQNMSKFSLERADKEVEFERGLEKEKREAERETAAEGRKTAAEIAKEEREAARKGKEGFTLSEGEQKYGPDNKLIAENVKDYEPGKGGSPEEIEAARAANVNKAERVMSTVDEALGFLEGAKGTGAIGRQIAQVFGDTESAALKRAITTIQASLAFDELQRMREASPTGGALGAVSEREIDLLQSTIANLSTNQPTDVLDANLRKVKEHYQNWKDTLNGINIDDPDYQALLNDPEMEGVPHEVIWEALGKPKEGSVSTNARLSPLAASIVTQESGGNYGAVGQMTKWGKALGKYQIMPNFHFSKIGLKDTPADHKKFLESPELQDKLFDMIINDLNKRYGGDPMKVAAAYYGGAGGASVVGTSAGDRPQTAGGKRFPSINEYARSVVSRLNQG